MTSRVLLTLAATGLSLGTVATSASAAPASAAPAESPTPTPARLSPQSLRDVIAAQRATARFFDLDAARRAGYTVTFVDRFGLTCIEDFTTPTHESEGGMGVHLVNPAFVGSTDPRHPAALVYRPAANGRLVLSALEYLVVEPRQPEAPTVFDRMMMFTPAGGKKVNRFMPDAFYSLHAWVWQPNPSGLFAMWNPKVDCPS